MEITAPVESARIRYIETPIAEVLHLNTLFFVSRLSVMRTTDPEAEAKRTYVCRWYVCRDQVVSKW